MSNLSFSTLVLPVFLSQSLVRASVCIQHIQWVPSFTPCHYFFSKKCAMQFVVCFSALWCKIRFSLFTLQNSLLDSISLCHIQFWQCTFFQHSSNPIRLIYNSALKVLSFTFGAQYNFQPPLRFSLFLLFYNNSLTRYFSVQVISFNTTFLRIFLKYFLFRHWRLKYVCLDSLTHLFSK